MKKFNKTLAVAIVAATCMGSAAVYSNTQNSDFCKNMSLMNSEVLAEAENLGGDWWTNFRMATVWYSSGSTWYLYNPWWSFSYSSMDCCINSSDADACDFGKENSMCSSKITRAARQ